MAAGGPASAPAAPAPAAPAPAAPAPVPASTPAAPAASVTAAEAATLYDRFCLACHGEAGDGRGPARPFVLPRPRDFVRGEFRWRTTASGSAPTDVDLARAIRFGVAGTSMHGFAATFDERQVAGLVDHVKRLAPRAFARPAVPVALPPAAAVTPALVERGRVVWGELGCAQCHGAGGRGDGPSAKGLVDDAGLPAVPYDLTTRPLRRPRAPGEAALPAIYASLVTGLDGTPMPSYDGAAPPADLWAVAAFVDAIRAPDARVPENAAPLDAAAVALDARDKAYRVGYWPGAPDAADAGPFGRVLRLLGARPAGLTPAQASPSAAQCARCHAEQAAEWRGSIHAAAGSPGLIGQLVPKERTVAHGVEIESCQRCHAPLAEQQPLIRAAHLGGADADRRYRRNPSFDPALREEGVTCAGCHVRDHRRLGPPRATDGKRLALPGYPLTELAVYQRSDFCLPCHQLAPRAALAGRPLLDTYREWLEGPYMRRGVQCQHCHMPDRDHTFKGVHDRDAFLQGIRLDTMAVRGAGGAVTVRARLWNAGAGHFLPTTPTPAAWIAVDLVDEDGEPIDGARATKRIGRHLVFEGGKFREVEDTRVPPGEARELAAAWKDGRVPEARAARVTVEVWPDEYYERLYRDLLRGARGVPRVLFAEALRRTVASRYTAVDRTIPIAAR